MDTSSGNELERVQELRDELDRIEKQARQLRPVAEPATTELGHLAALRGELEELEEQARQQRARWQETVAQVMDKREELNTAAVKATDNHSQVQVAQAAGLARSWLAILLKRRPKPKRKARK